MTEQARISDDLRVTLAQVWSLGFLDCMAGEEVTDEHRFPSELASPLRLMAEGCIDAAEPLIAANFQENPQVVYDTVYRVGYELCDNLNQALGPPQINLN